MRSINKANIIAAFSITLLIFIAGFSTSTLVYNRKISTIQELQESLYTDNLEIEAQYELAYQDVCDITSLLTLNRNLNELSEKLQYLEKEMLDENSQSILKNIKRQYFVLEIKHWLFVQSVKEECNYDYSTILYFYANRDCPACEAQGLVLTEYKQTHQNTMIYSFDTRFPESQIVSNLIDKYNISEAPSIIYNDNVFDYLVSSEELENLIN